MKKNYFEEKQVLRKWNFEENQLEEFHVGRCRDPPYKNVDYRRRV